MLFLQALLPEFKFFLSSKMLILASEVWVFTHCFPIFSQQCGIWRSSTFLWVCDDRRRGPGVTYLSYMYPQCIHTTCTNKVLHCFGSQLFFDNFGSIWIHDDNLWCQLTLLLEYIAGFIYIFTDFGRGIFYFILRRF